MEIQNSSSPFLKISVTEQIANSRRLIEEKDLAIAEWFFEAGFLHKVEHYEGDDKIINYFFTVAVPNVSHLHHIAEKNLTGFNFNFKIVSGGVFEEFFQYANDKRKDRMLQREAVRSTLKLLLGKSPKLNNEVNLTITPFQLSVMRSYIEFLEEKYGFTTNL